MATKKQKGKRKHSDTKSEDFSDNRSPPSKRRKVEKDVDTKLDEHVRKFLHDRTKRTQIHPSKDPVIIFLLRVLKKFLLSDDHRLYINRLFTHLTDKLGVGSSTLYKLRNIFNLFPKGCFKYKKYGKNRTETRLFELNPNDKQFDTSHENFSSSFEDALKFMQKFRYLLKYSAWHYSDDSKSSDNDVKWQWIGDGLSSDDVLNEYTEFEAVSNGQDTFRVGDVVMVRHEGVTISPWLGRITQFFEDESTDKTDDSMRMKFRYFYFWDQILDDIRSEMDMDTLQQSAQDILSLYPPAAGDVFEKIKDSEEMMDTVEIIERKVYLVSDNTVGFVDCDKVFECGYFYDPATLQFVAKGEVDLREDSRRFSEGMDSILGAASDHESDDGVVSDIKMNGTDPSAFTVQKEERGHGWKRKRRQSDKASVQRVDSGLLSLVEDSPLEEKSD